jgi:hypothetical protein
LIRRGPRNGVIGNGGVNLTHSDDCTVTSPRTAKPRPRRTRRAFGPAVSRPKVDRLFKDTAL